MKRARIVIFPLFLGIYSLLLLCLKKGGPTAYEWPAMDMAAFFERYFDHEFLRNDFFTNSSSAINPRHIFGYLIIFLSQIFDCSWYDVFFALKIIFSGFLPALFYLVLVKSYRNRFSDSTFESDLLAQTVAFIAVVLLLKNPNLLSIAWWPAIIFFVAPQTLALFLGLLGGLIYLVNHQNNYRFLAAIFFSLSALSHPTVGAIVLLLIFILAVKGVKQILDFALIALLVLLPSMLLVTKLFATAATLGNQEFINIYIGSHPSHYLVSQFGSLNGDPWFYNFILINAVLVLILFAAFLKQDRQLKIAAFMAFISYLGCILLQYFTVEIFPSKIMALLGISRFSMFGYWMMTLVLMRVAYYQNWKINYKKIAEILSHKLLKRIGIAAFVVIFTASFFAADNPFESRSNEMTRWIQNNTDKNSLFAVNQSMQLDTTLIAKRALVVGPGFPFNEEFFLEYWKRKNDLYGSKIPFDMMSRDQFFALQKQYGFDYILLNSDNLDKTMQQIIPDFKWREYSIYAASKLVR